MSEPKKAFKEEVATHINDLATKYNKLVDIVEMISTALSKGAFTRDIHRTIYHLINDKENDMKYPGYKEAEKEIDGYLVEEEPYLLC